MKCRCGQVVNAEMVLAFSLGADGLIDVHLCAETDNPQMATIALNLKHLAEEMVPNLKSEVGRERE